MIRPHFLVLAGLTGIFLTLDFMEHSLGAGHGPWPGYEFILAAGASILFCALAWALGILLGKKEQA